MPVMPDVETHDVSTPAAASAGDASPQGSETRAGVAAPVPPDSPLLPYNDGTLQSLSPAPGLGAGGAPLAAGEPTPGGASSGGVPIISDEATARLAATAASETAAAAAAAAVADAKTADAAPDLVQKMLMMSMRALDLSFAALHLDLA